MKPTISCVTLPVDNLRRSATFYREGLGLPIDAEAKVDPPADHVPIDLPGGHYLVLSLRSDFDTFTKMANVKSAPQRTCECILSYFASSREEVETILTRCKAAGGNVPQDPRDESWGYAGFVTDPDGHLWEVMWNANMAGA